MSLPRTLILDLFARYPDADTIEDAVAAHDRTLKAAVDAKWAELDAAVKEHDAFQGYASGKPVSVPAKPPAIVVPERPADTLDLRFVPKIRQSRQRNGSGEIEYRYGSNQYSAVAASRKIGTFCKKTGLWVTASEIATIRADLLQKDAERLRSIAAGTKSRRVSLNFDRRYRVRPGTTLVEHQYRCSEYYSLAEAGKFGTLDGGHVWLTSEELDRVRAVVRDRHAERVRAQMES